MIGVSAVFRCRGHREIAEEGVQGRVSSSRCVSGGSILSRANAAEPLSACKYYDVIHDAGRDNNRRKAFEALARCSVRLAFDEGGRTPGLAKDSLSALFIRIIWPYDNLWPRNLSTVARPRLRHGLYFFFFLFFCFLFASFYLFGSTLFRRKFRAFTRV